MNRLSSRLSLTILVVASTLVVVAFAFGPWGPVAVLAVLGLVALAVASRYKPSLAMAGWLLAILAVPPWIYVNAAGYRVAPAAILSIVVILGSLGPGMRLRGWVDWSVLALAALLMISSQFGSPFFLVVQGLGEWVLCYLAGRMLLPRVTSAIKVMAAIGAALAALAILQYWSQYNVADWLGQIPGATSGSQWMPLQYRGGNIRAEVSLGHSISLGGVLALCLPFALRLPSVPARLAVSALVVGGILATQSRAALLAAALCIAISVLTSAKFPLAMRALLAIPALVALIALLPQLIESFVFGGGDTSSEVNQGTVYRVDILATAGNVNLIGVASNASVASDGTFVWGRIASVDNGFLYIALYLGALAAVAYVTPMIAVATRTFRGNADPFALSILVQIPLFLTVAPITQYQSVYWFVVGLAMAQEYQRRRAGTEESLLRARHDSRPSLVSLQEAKVAK